MKNALGNYGTFHIVKLNIYPFLKGFATCAGMVGEDFPSDYRVLTKRSASEVLANDRGTIGGDFIKVLQQRIEVRLKVASRFCVTSNFSHSYQQDRNHNSISNSADKKTADTTGSAAFSWSIFCRD